MELFSDEKNDFSECYLYNRNDFINDLQIDPADENNLCAILNMEGGAPKPPGPNCGCTEKLSDDAASCIACPSG